MKFLCIDCDVQMDYEDRRQPGDGTFAAAFSCSSCGRRIAMLANPMETQLVESLGVQIGGRALAPEPMELVRSSMVGRDDAFDETEADPPGKPRWTPESRARLERVPRFVRSMVRSIYNQWAEEHGIKEITPSIMDQARADLGLEGM